MRKQKTLDLNGYTYTMTQLGGTSLAAGLTRARREIATLQKDGHKPEELFLLFPEEAITYFADLFGKQTQCVSTTGEIVRMDMVAGREEHFDADRLEDFFGWLLASFMWNYAGFFGRISRGQAAPGEPSESPQTSK